VLIMTAVGSWPGCVTFRRPFRLFGAAPSLPPTSPTPTLAFRLGQQGPARHHLEHALHLFEAPGRAEEYRQAEEIARHLLSPAANLTP
jgi:hypothetical protein